MEKEAALLLVQGVSATVPASPPSCCCDFSKLCCYHHHGDHALAEVHIREDRHTHNARARTRMLAPIDVRQKDILSLPKQIRTRTHTCSNYTHTWYCAKPLSYA